MNQSAAGPISARNKLPNYTTSVGVSLELLVSYENMSKIIPRSFIHVTPEHLH